MKDTTRKINGVNVEISYGDVYYDKFLERDMCDVTASCDTIHGHWHYMFDASVIFIKSSQWDSYVDSLLLIQFENANPDLIWA